MIEFSKSFRLVILGEEDAPHQDVPFDVIGIFLQDLFRQALGLADGRGGLLAAGQEIISQARAYVEVICVQLDSLLHLVEGLLIALESFVSIRQSPMRVGETIVDLQRSAEFKRCFLKLFVFQQCLTAGDVLGLGFFGRGAGPDDQGHTQEGKKQS